MACKEIPLISACSVVAVGKPLLAALAEEGRLFKEDLINEDFERWEASRKVAEQLAVDYAALVHLYLEGIAIQAAFPEYSI